MRDAIQGMLSMSRMGNPIQLSSSAGASLLSSHHHGKSSLATAAADDDLEAKTCFKDDEFGKYGFFGSFPNFLLKFLSVDEIY